MNPFQDVRDWIDGSLGICFEDPGGPVVFIRWDTGERTSCLRAGLVVVSDEPGAQR